MTTDSTPGPVVRKPGAYFGLPLAFWVFVFLAAGLGAGLLFPGNRVAVAAYNSGTYFPKLIVTFATLIIFTLLSGATAKLVLFHRKQAGRLFALILAAYVALGAASLAYVAILIPILTGLPLSAPGATVMSFGAWFLQVGRTFGTLISDQPLIQVLVAAVGLGYFTATIAPLHRVAHGLVLAGQLTLGLFKKLLWYYPVMIGCLAIGIPLKFGFQGMTAYGQAILWVGAATVSWSVVLVMAVKLTTKRTFRQLFSYYASVWPMGFGTGGSYETLAMNVVSAEHDLGLPREIAEVSIVFGTVLNKSCAGMSVLLVTIAVSRLLSIPISLAEILLLIPPVLILSLESPGIPGGAAFFMSPIVAVLLNVPSAEVFVATFVAMYSGLIPMFSTAGNTTNDGLVGAVLNDRFAGYLTLGQGSQAAELRGATALVPRRAGGVRGLLGWAVLAVGVWMLVSPQSILGLNQLKWMHRYSFQGEAVLGALVLTVSVYVLASMGVGEDTKQ